MKKGFFALKITGTETRDVVAARAAPGGGLGCSHEPSTALKPRTGTPHPPVRGADPRDPQSRGAAAPHPQTLRDTHIVWNGEFMGGGLGRGIQTCSETERGPR